MFTATASDDLSAWPVAILAGGLATRLRPITETIPKSLVSVAGEPFLAHQLRLLHGRGLRRVVLCVGHLGERIEAEFGDGAAFGVDVQYSFDGPRLLGTGGALRRALPLLGARFLVLYGDSYLPMNYAAAVRAFEGSGQPALMTVFNNEGRWDTSNVFFADSTIRLYHKQNRTAEMRHIDYGLGILRADVLASRPADQPFDLADVYAELVARGELAGYEVRERFYEVGSHAGLAELDELLATPSHPASSIQAMSTYSEQHLRETAAIVTQLDPAVCERAVDVLASARAGGGRLFILGVGGSAANASHAVNDFRKIAGFEAYAPTDNVSELTARTNDEGWAGVFAEWLKGSRLNDRDVLLVFSVGGGNLEKNVSPNLVAALELAKERGASVVGVVGRDGGHTARVADAVVIVPTVNPENITPHAEAFQGVVWHLFVSHPKLKVAPTKWESTK